MEINGRKPMNFIYKNQNQKKTNKVQSSGGKDNINARYNTKME